MATRDWGALDWKPMVFDQMGPSMGSPVLRDLGGPMADADLPNWYQDQKYKVAYNPQNEQLIRSLGFTGNAIAQQPTPDAAAGEGYSFLDPSFLQANGLSDAYANPSGTRWSPEARQWMMQNGIHEAIAHDPGTSEGGRPEYYGLVKDGKFLEGQYEPTTIMTDTLMDQITPFLMMAGPFLNAAGVIGGAGGAAGTGTLAATDSGVASLGSAWSPEALGLTSVGNAGSSAASSLLGELGGWVAPSVGGAGAGGIATLGGSSSGLTSLGAGMSPEALGLTQAITPGVTASELASLSAALPGPVGSGVGYLTGGGTDVTPISQEVIGNVTPGVSPADLANLSSPLPTAGGLTPDQLFQQAADDALQSSGNYYNQSPLGQWTTDVSNVAELGGGGVLDYLGAAGQNLPSLPNPLSSTGGTLGSAIQPIANAVGGGGNLAAIIGAGLGAASGGGTETSSRDPWAAAQPFLRNLLGDADAMRANFAANPYTPEQTKQYQQAFSGLDQARAAVPGLLSWGQNAMQRQSTTPSYAQLFGGGLLGQQPTAQAGGAGGLLGDNPQDRIQALMARGRGLMG